MDITPVIPKARQTLTGYGDGGFKINGERMEGSVLLTADASASWNATSFSDIDFNALLFWCEQNREIEILLIGCGKTLMQPPAVFRANLRKINIALDVMDTGAACRTYNVLLAEERKVAAALIAV